MGKCNNCGGKGAKTCSACKGTGRQGSWVDHGKCNKCQGSGEVKCAACGGKGSN